MTVLCCLTFYWDRNGIWSVSHIYCIQFNKFSHMYIPLKSLPRSRQSTFHRPHKLDLLQIFYLFLSCGFLFKFRFKGFLLNFSAANLSIIYSRASSFFFIFNALLRNPIPGLFINSPTFSSSIFLWFHFYTFKFLRLFLSWVAAQNILYNGKLDL